jgi:hypothetical protein
MLLNQRQIDTNVKYLNLLSTWSRVRSFFLVYGENLVGMGEYNIVTGKKYYVDK